MSTTILNQDTLQKATVSLNLADILSCSQVCKEWNTAMQYYGIWLQMFDKEKIPGIASRTETAAEDFKFMSSITQSAMKSAFLGKFVGQVPMISEEIFNMLKAGMDPYEPHKKMSDAFVVVVEPTHWEVPYDPVLFNDLLDKGDFEATGEEKEKGILVPHSPKNVKILGHHAAKKLGIKDIFNQAYLSEQKVQEILNQCSTVAKTVKVTIMRKEAPPQTFNKTKTAQKDLLELNGHENVSLRTLYYYNLVQKLAKESSPALHQFSQTADETGTGPVVVSHFTHPGGPCFHFSQKPYCAVGAVPILSAKILYPNGPLTLN